MKIEFMKNGFQINGNKFVAYQAIASINEIKIKDEYKGFYDVVLMRHTEEFAEKQVYFRIVLLDGSEIKITVDNCKSIYSYTDGKSSKSIFSFLWWWITHIEGDYGSIQSPSKIIKTWLDDDSNVKFIVNETKNLRDELVSKFNEWKN
jgi:hypothetical protein